MLLLLLPPLFPPNFFFQREVEVIDLVAKKRKQGMLYVVCNAVSAGDSHARENSRPLKRGFC
jgi:hypothetical protein